MRKKRATVEEELVSADIAISNVINDAEILSYITPFGYDLNRLNEGKSLYKLANQLAHAKTTKHNEKCAANIMLHKKWEEVKEFYIVQISLARIVLKRKHYFYVKLGLNEERKPTLSDWLTQATNFYINALDDSDIITELTTTGVTGAKLNEGRGLVEELELLNAEHLEKVAASQQATKSRDLALKDLREWLSAFIGTARIALAEKPQLLEKLGVKVKS